LGDAAYFDRDHVGADRAGRERGGDPGGDLGVGAAAVQQQHLDQLADAFAVAVRAAGGGPERAVLGGEHPGPASLGQRGRTG